MKIEPNLKSFFVPFSFSFSFHLHLSTHTHTQEHMFAHSLSITHTHTHTERKKELGGSFLPIFLLSSNLFPLLILRNERTVERRGGSAVDRSLDQHAQESL